MGEIRNRPGNRATVQLTAPELLIAERVSAGSTTSEVGTQRYLSRRTVEAHLPVIFDKLGLASDGAIHGQPISEVIAALHVRARPDDGSSPSAAAVCSALGEAAFDAYFRRMLDSGADEPVLDELAADAVPPEPWAGARLTRREREIAAHIARGLSNRQIADQLQIARRTVESHVENILIKLGFRSRVQVAIWYAQG
jgi:DNA-binding NarL/FixJ family response regulator